MFTSAVEEIFKRMNIKTGVKVNEERLINMRFADDIILFARSEEHLENLLKDLNVEGKRDGLKMNREKTKIMCNGVAKQ